MNRYTLILIGPPQVGKSRCALRLSCNRYPKKDVYSPTIGADFCTRELVKDDIMTRFSIWDVSGGNGYRSTMDILKQKADGLCLCYDITDRASFELATQDFIHDIRIYGREDTTVILVGTKMDLSPQRQVSIEEAEHLATLNGMRFIEVSALTGDHLEDLLSNLI